jgi:hypothetical protein
MNMKEQIETPLTQLKVINATFNAENNAKFMAGQKQHGGNFMLKPTVRAIREECLDLVNYTHVLNEHRRQALVVIDEIENYIKLYGATASADEVESKMSRLKTIIHDL